MVVRSMSSDTTEQFDAAVEAVKAGKPFYWEITGNYYGWRKQVQGRMEELGGGATVLGGCARGDGGGASAAAALGSADDADTKAKGKSKSEAEANADGTDVEDARDDTRSSGACTRQKVNVDHVMDEETSCTHVYTTWWGLYKLSSVDPHSLKLPGFTTLEPMK